MTVMGCFSLNLSVSIVLHAELNGAMLAIETVFQRGWNRLWLENDSLLVIQAFRNPDLVPWKLTKR